jgi:Cu+-exporting ATPase
MECCEGQTKRKLALALHDEGKRHLAFTAVIGVALLLRWLNIIQSVFGVDFALIVAIIGGYKFFYGTIYELIFERKIAVDALVAVAAGAALYASEYFAAAEVILIMLIGEALEHYAVGQTRAALSELASAIPDVAHLVKDGEVFDVPVERLSVGDIVLIKPGERIPVDGEVVEGSSSVDESTITGESMPKDKFKGDMVYAGTINLIGSLYVQAKAVSNETLISKIMRMVEEAQERKASIERTADKYARWFLAVVMVAASVTFVLSKELMRCVAVLIIACPCALVLSTPTAIVSAIGRLAREGILAKGGNAVEALGKVDCVVFDKTGTLTLGSPKLTDIFTLGDFDEQALLSYAGSVELASEHLLGKLIVEASKGRGVNLVHPVNVKVYPGMGIAGNVGGKRIAVGNRKLLSALDIPLPQEADEKWRSMEADGKTIVSVAVDGEVAGLIAFSDEPRPEAKDAIDALSALGIKRIAMLTGDALQAARAVAEKLGIGEVHAELLPHEKVERVNELRAQKLFVAMVGDGINDAPALASADVGIAMGGVGTNLTAEAGDIVIMTDELTKVPIAIDVGRAALKKIHQNIIAFAIGFNSVAVLLAGFGYIPPVWAAVVHQASSLMVVCNSLTLLSRRRIKPLRSLGAFLRRVEEVAQALQWESISEFVSHHKSLLKRITPVALFAGYILSGFYMVRANERAIVLRFGKFVREAPPGLHYHLPSPFEKVIKVDALTRRRVEVGFRTKQQEASKEPVVYEWAFKHLIAGYERRPEEGIVVTGDENLLEVNMIVHYSISDAFRFALRCNSAEDILLPLSEAVLRSVFSRQPMYAPLVERRKEIERQLLSSLREALLRYGVGITVHDVKLQDVHPPLEADVVDAFHEVARALEMKAQLINEAEAYMREKVPEARGEAMSQLLGAIAFSHERLNRALGEASKFKAVATQYARAREIHRLRLYWDTLEEALPNLKKYIVATDKAGRHRIIFLPQEVTLKEGTKQQGEIMVAPTVEELEHTITGGGKR